MSLKESLALQPTCDAEGCLWIIEGDVQYWYQTPHEAIEAWREHEGWTDGTTWFCDNHKMDPHEYVGTREQCDRCLIEREEHDDA